MILKEQSSLTFEGMRQVYEHYLSNAHQSSLLWFSENSTVDQDAADTKHSKPQRGITYFFRPLSQNVSVVPCLHLWEPKIADQFIDDSAIDESLQ